MGNTGNKKVGFGSADGERLATGAAEGVFEKENGAFDEDAVAIEIIPMDSATRDARVEAKLLVGVGVDAAPIGGIGAGVRASARVSIYASMP